MFCAELNCSFSVHYGTKHCSVLRIAELLGLRRSIKDPKWFNRSHGNHLAELYET